MSEIRDEMLMRAAFAPARALEPSEADVARVLARAKTSSRRTLHLPTFAGWRALAAPGLAVLALLAGTAYAVPASRAAIDDVASSVAGTFAFDKWMGGDSADAPGRELGAGEQAPDYFRNGAWSRRHVRDPRVIAEAGGYKLYAYRERSGSIGFDLGDTGVGVGGFAARDFEGRALYLLGGGTMNAPDAHGHFPFFFIAAKSVRSVELTYDEGPPLRVDGVDGGFVLLMEPSRGPREVIAYDSDGEAVGRQTILRRQAIPGFSSRGPGG